MKLAVVMLYLLAIVAHVSPLWTKWNFLHPETMPDWIGVGVDTAVVVVLVVVVLVVVVVKLGLCPTMLTQA